MIREEKLAIECADDICKIQRDPKLTKEQKAAEISRRIVKNAISLASATPIARLLAQKSFEKRLGVIQ